MMTQTVKKMCWATCVLGMSMGMAGGMLGLAPANEDTAPSSLAPISLSTSKFKLNGKEYTARVRVIRYVPIETIDPPEPSTITVTVELSGPDIATITSRRVPKMTLNLGRQRWTPQLQPAPVPFAAPSGAGDAVFRPDYALFQATSTTVRWKAGDRLTGKLEVRDARRSVSASFNRIFVSFASPLAANADTSAE